MRVNIEQLDSIPIVMLHHTGPYDKIGEAFERLWRWVGEHQVPVRRTIGIYWDNPDYVDAAQLRSAACVEIPPGFAVPDPGNLPLRVSAIESGSYATTRYVGPYDQMASVWTNFTTAIEDGLKREISDKPAFEVYVNDPADTPASELITELYMPLA